jgi:hypothetical protein
MRPLHATGIDLIARARIRRLCRFIASESTMISGASQRRLRAFSHDLSGHCANTRSAGAVRHSQSLRAAFGPANGAEISLGRLMAQHFAALASTSGPYRHYPCYIMRCEACGACARTSSVAAISPDLLKNRFPKARLALNPAFAARP